jgi:hypothetical protein
MSKALEMENANMGGAPFTIIFPERYDARCTYETPSKGYLSDVEVRLEDGSCCKLYFTDPVRLQ